MKTPVSWAGLAFAGVLSFGAATYYQMQHDQKSMQTMSKVVTTGKPNLGGAWTLIESSTGKFVTNKAYEDQYTILYFGFAHCPDICPSELRKLSTVIDALKVSLLGYSKGFRT